MRPHGRLAHCSFWILVSKYTIFTFFLIPMSRKICISIDNIKWYIVHSIRLYYYYIYIYIYHIIINLSHFYHVLITVGNTLILELLFFFFFFTKLTTAMSANYGQHCELSNFALATQGTDKVTAKITYVLLVKIVTDEPIKPTNFYR